MSAAADMLNLLSKVHGQTPKQVNPPLLTFLRRASSSGGSHISNCSQSLVLATTMALRSSNDDIFTPRSCLVLSSSELTSSCKFAGNDQQQKTCYHWVILIEEGWLRFGIHIHLHYGILAVICSGFIYRKMLNKRAWCVDKHPGELRGSRGAFWGFWSKFWSFLTNFCLFLVKSCTPKCWGRVYLALYGISGLGQIGGCASNRM